MLVGTTALLYPVSALTIALAPTFVEEILGPKWEGTGLVIRILSLVMMIDLFGEVIRPILKGIGQPDKMTFIELVQTIILIILVWGLANQFGIVGAALAWLPAVTVSQVISVAFIKKIMDRPFAGLFVPMLAIVVATGTGAILAFMISQLIPGLFGFFIAFLLALCFMGAFMWVAERHYSLGFFRDFMLMFPQIAGFLKLEYKSTDS
jgi:O-antigen/teichoic acid export membrane protein